METTPTVTRRLRWLPVLGVFLAALVITVARLGFHRFSFALWEDGWVWPNEALSLPGAAVFGPYGGYLHVIPKASAAALLGILPPEWYAGGLTVTATIFESLIAASVFWLSRDLIPLVWARVALALLPALLPMATSEVIGTLSNLHSYLVVLAFWIIVARHRSWRAAWLWAIPLLLAVLSCPEAPLLFLLVPWVLLRRDRRAWPSIGALVVGEIIQKVVSPIEDFVRPNSGLHLWSLPEGWIINTVLPIFNGNAQWQQSMFGSHFWLRPTLFFLVFVVLLVVILIKGSAQQRFLGLALFAGSFALYAGSAISNGWPGIDYATMSRDALLTTGAFNTRYGFASGVFLAALIPLFATVIGSMRARSKVQAGETAVDRQGWWKRLLGAMQPQPAASTVPAARLRPLRLVISGIAVLFVVLMLTWPSPPSFTPDPTTAWAYQVDEARDQCLASDLPDTSILVGPPVGGLPVELPCSYVER